MTRIRVAPFVCLVSLVIGRLLFAHNLDNKMTYLTFDQETLAMIDIDKPNAEQTIMLVNGMENFIGVLGNVVMGIGQERH